MNVYVLSGCVGATKCHVEVFEDSEIGKKLAEIRKGELQSLNNGWVLVIERFRIQNCPSIRKGAV